MWKYLYSESFKLRYVLAAYFLKDCDEIIEIGGFKTPITNFLDNKKTIVIDPLVDYFESSIHHHIPILFQDWKGCPSCENYGVVMMGLEFKSPEEGWLKLFDLINKSKILVVETSIDFIWSLQQLERIKQNINKKPTISFDLDLTGNDFGDLTDSYPPYCKRKFTVLK